MLSNIRKWFPAAPHLRESASVDSGLALSTHGIRAIAQETSGTLAGHPIVGV
ncbi:MAG: hypothetical protein WKF63_03790 [Thermomicrobiales bacterium]